MKRILLYAGAFALAAAAHASTPTAWEMNSYRDFIAGRLSGLSLTRDGRLQLGPKLDTFFASGQPIVWSVVEAPDGTVYAATGHRGRVFRIDAAGNSSLLWTAGQPEVFALALDSRGALYAATSPDGKIYRIENGKAAEYFSPGAKYIWSLAFGPDGALYAGTGSEGKIYRIEAAGKGEVYYDSGQSHITCLAFDSKGRLLAGSEPNGILYRISAREKAFALYDSSLPEIHSIAAAPDGTVYAAALGGSLSRRALGGVMSTAGLPSSVAVSATATTITVEADEQQGPDIKPKPEQAKPPVQAPVVAPAPAAVEVSGIEKSAIYRINPDNTVETLWSSKDENAYDLLLSGGDVVFSTDAQGRVYRLNGARQAALVAQTNEGEATRLLSGRAGLLAATGDSGKLYRLAAESAATGAYESPVYDAGAVARWGRLSWLGELPDGSRVLIRTRSGNSLRPDSTWSDWSEPLTDPSGARVTSPNARYIQWKAELSGSPARGPALDSVTLAYLPQNTAPVVRSITVLSQPATPKASQQAQPSSGAAAAYTVNVSDSGDPAAAASTGTPTQQLTRSSSDQIQITWQADDPEGDRLVYALYFRGEGEREWKLLKDNLSDNSYSIDADALADGRYFFRVVASDSPANPPADARQAQLVSSPTLIDHTPPVVTLGAPKRAGAHFELDFEAVDAASPIRRCEYAIDAGPWTPVNPVDGILDSPRERFSLKLDDFPAGEHLFVVRAVDSANNAGLAKLLVKNQ